MHLILLSLPFLTTPVAWTLTNVCHNLVIWNLFLFLKMNSFILQNWLKKKKRLRSICYTLLKAHLGKLLTRVGLDRSHTGNKLTTVFSSHQLENFSLQYRSFCTFLFEFHNSFFFSSLIKHTLNWKIDSCWQASTQNTIQLIFS